MVPEEIEKIQAPHIKEFLNGCKVGPRRWNNLRDQVVTLFRFARSERYLPKDRTTEAEDVAKMKVARKTVDMFTPADLRIILENSPVAGCRGSFSALSPESARSRCCGWIGRAWRWEQKLIDLPPEVTKVNERRIIPVCDSLIEALTPWRQATGPCARSQSSAAEIEQIMARVKKTHPAFRWKHNALRHVQLSHGTDSKMFRKSRWRWVTRSTW